MWQDIKNTFYHLPKAFLANIYYGFPASGGGMTVVGVSGTDGKSTTVNMIYQILKAAGKKVSMVSTVDVFVGGKFYDTGFHVTSPDPFTVQKFARTAKDNGDKYLIFEVSSHAIDQYRFWGIKFDIGVITNITHEHLDYHKTMEKYQDVKLNFLRKAKIKIINQSIKFNGEDKFTFGLQKGDFNQRQVKLKLKIPGDYNVENALAAFAVAFVLGVDKTIAKKSLESFSGILGRMDEVQNYRGIRIFIDYAHTPNGLMQALKTLRKQASGRLITLIGCEGERDEGKRPLMGEIAQRFSDSVIITAVDPRGQLANINKQILSGMKSNESIFVIEDRNEAIDFAIRKLAKTGDIVGIFGKGHETSMNLDGKSGIHWSDFEVVKKVLNG